MGEQMSTTPSSADPVEATSAVKHTQGRSFRITPPLEIRKAVSMEVDEPWTWFWHAGSERFWIRRTGVQLSGIPDDANSVGVSESRRNGNYVDFAIPPEAISAGDMERGEPWRWRVLDFNTMALIRE